MNSWRIESPDGRLSLTVELDGSGAAGYAVARDNVSLVGGALGLELDTVDLTTGLSAMTSTETTVSSSYSLPFGKARAGAADATQLSVVFEGPDGTAIEVVARAYNNGVAFRYRLPGNGTRRITGEATTLEFAAEGRAWIQKTDLPARSTPAYESLHCNAVPIGHQAPVPSWNLPALFELNETFVLVSEADTDGTYFGGHIDTIEGRPAYRWAAPQVGEGGGVGDRFPTHTGPWTLPWRMLVIGELATVAESNMVQLLARPGLPSADWIKPGKVTWSWWSDHHSPQDPAALHDYVDLAAELGWDHTLVDANWNLNDEADIRSLIDDANTRGIGVFLWYNSGGPNNVVTEQPRDRLFDAGVRRAELAMLVDWGVAGIKVDFWHSDKAESNGRYLALAEDAYNAGLMVNFHGSTIPRGWEVRFPNIMTMEAVRGAEQYSFAEGFPAEAPWLNTILPFTRNVVGSMDYTPVTFSDVAYPHHTTNAHELALAVVFESALGHFADSAASYRAQSDEVLDFLRRVPVVWDETRLLSGYPGEHAVFARRLGSDWWIAGINGTDVDLTTELDLSLLDGADSSAARLFTDAGPRRIATSDIEPGAGLSVTMAPLGGFALAPLP